MAVFSVGVIVLFIFEIFAVGFFRTGVNPFTSGFSDPPIQTSREEGTAEFDALLQYYEPYLVSASLSEAQAHAIREHPRVLGLTNSQQGYIIELRDREDVPAVYSFLLENNASARAVALFSAPSALGVRLADGRVIETTGNDRYLLRKELEPSIPVSTPVPASMLAVVEGGQITAYGELELMSFISSTLVEGSVVDVLYLDHSFSVPWAERNDVDADMVRQTYGAFNATYERKDYILFTPSLSIQEQQQKRNVSYVTRIGPNSASINSSFIDGVAISQDFNTSNITFPASILHVRSNGTVPLTYPVITEYAYSVRLQNGSLVLPVTEITHISERSYAMGDSIRLNITGEILAGTLLDIIAVEDIN